MIFLAHLSSKLKQGNCRYASSLSLCKLFQSLREQCVSLWETRGCLQFVLNTVAARFFTLLPQPSPASQGRANYKPTPAAAERVEGLFADDVHAGRRGEFELFGRDAAVALHVAEGEDGLGAAAVYHHRGDGVAVQDDPERVVFFLVGFGF